MSRQYRAFAASVILHTIFDSCSPWEVICKQCTRSWDAGGVDDGECQSSTAAVTYLLQLVLDRRARRVFDRLSDIVAEQIYEGYWFDPATQSQLASIQPFTQLATGEITVALYRGNISFHAATSVPHSLYSEETASMEDIGDFNHADSEGFLSVLGVSARALAVSGQIED